MTELTCNTEKDRGVHLNHKTAGVHMYNILLTAWFILLGILAGLWPCGVITILSKLFVSESKAQVYGHLHNVLQVHPTLQ